MRWEKAQDPGGYEVWRAASPNDAGSFYTVWEDTNDRVHWSLRRPGVPTGKGSPVTFRSWTAAAKDAEDHAKSKGRYNPERAFS